MTHDIIAVQLAKDPLVLKYDLSVIRHINSGAAPLGKEHVDALMKRMPCAILTNLQVLFYLMMKILDLQSFTDMDRLNPQEVLDALYA